MLKWIVVGLAIIALWTPPPSELSTQAAAVHVIYAVLAIFFKLQEDSNKPTVEE